MTPRALALALVPVAFLLAGTADPALVWAALATGLLWAGACLLDRLRARGPDGWRVRRLVEPILSLGAANPVTLEITPLGRYPTSVLVRDEGPPELPPDPPLLRGRARGGVPLRLTYVLRPTRRGRYDFARVVLRAPGPLGLWNRQVALPRPAEVRVYPDLGAVRQWQGLTRRGQLAQVGIRNARRLGQGTEFAMVREHFPDDDFRLINWRATGRMGRLMVSEHRPETAQTCWLVLDCGRHMQGGIGALQKLDHALNTALLFAYVALTGGDRVGVLAFADTVRAQLPAAGGRAHFARILELLYGIAPQPVEADHATALARLRRMQGRRALVLMFTDLPDGAAGARLADHAALLRPRHLPLVVTQQDPALAAAAGAAPTGPEVLYERAAALAVLADRAGGLEALRRRGVLSLDSEVAALAPTVINRYLELKARGQL